MLDALFYESIRYFKNDSSKNRNMKNSRRKFLKYAGMAGLSIAGSKIPKGFSLMHDPSLARHYLAWCFFWWGPESTGYFMLSKRCWYGQDRMRRIIRWRNANRPGYFILPERGQMKWSRAKRAIHYDVLSLASTQRGIERWSTKKTGG